MTKFAPQSTPLEWKKAAPRRNQRRWHSFHVIEPTLASHYITEALHREMYEFCAQQFGKGGKCGYVDLGDETVNWYFEHETWGFRNEADMIVFVLRFAGE